MAFLHRRGFKMYKAFYWGKWFCADRQSQYGAYSSQAESAHKKRDVRMRRACNCNKEAQSLFAAAVSSPAIPCLTKCMTGDLHGML